MATNTETLSALLSELETERLDLLREDPYGHRLQVISGLIYRTKVALLAHETEVPADLQQHPAIVALREKLRKKR